MPPTDSIEQLRALNTILSRLSGENAERAVHAEAALNFYATGAEPKGDGRTGGRNIPSREVARAASSLVRLHLAAGNQGGEGKIAFAHWHAEADYANGPLWMRQALIKEMKPLAGRPAAVLLITGLREAVCPDNRRWTHARRVEYAQARHWIESFACQRNSPHTHLQIIVL